MSIIENRFLQGISFCSQIAASFGIYRVGNRLFRNNVRIIMLHGVTKKHNSVANFDQKHIETEKLDAFITILKKNYTIISVEQFLSCGSQKNSALPKNAILVTFDDGYENCYTTLLPLLKKHHIPITIFLPTAYIGKKEIAWYDMVTYCIAQTKQKEITLAGKKYILGREEQKVSAIVELKKKVRDDPAQRESLLAELENTTAVKRSSCTNEDFLFMSWSQCREMKKYGVTFGSHSVTHQIMTMQPEKEIIKEMSDSKKIIEKELSSPCSYFAYPFGYSNTRMEEILRNLGYTAGLTTAYGTNTLETNRMALRRISLNNWYDAHILTLSLFFNFPTMHHWLRKKYSTINS